MYVGNTEMIWKKNGLEVLRLINTKFYMKKGQVIESVNFMT